MAGKEINPYLGFSPEQLKSELWGIYQQLPPITVLPFTHDMSYDELRAAEKADDEYMNEVLPQRMRSEHRKALIKRMGWLIECSRPFTTRGFRIKIGQSFNTAYDLGINRENEIQDPESLYHSLGLNFPDNFSIYDPQIVPILEQRRYRKTLEGYMLWVKAKDPENYKRREESEADPDFLEFLQWEQTKKLFGLAEATRMEKELQKWRGEYIKRWGNEP